ncbi:MAG TPA: CsbD family protein [Fimbriimonadaceae bacterium]|nr:CsbD family protein [Fimbriimonadaceae bacterium]HRJ95369.1 CsbD family protein [Fimbriimonadaceae bacterium]
MNWNIIEGHWKELTGAIREKWGDLTDDEITQLEGKRDQLEGLIQKRY